MNRNNFLPHIALALVLILVAAFAGQYRNWQKKMRSSVRIIPGATKTHEPHDRDAIFHEDEKSSLHGEVLVKFRTGVSNKAVEEIVTRLHDQVEDEIESVPGLQSIDDLDNADAEAIVAEYAALPEVEYAEANALISLDHAGGGGNHLHATDPRFSEQWSLANEGQDGGKLGADISAMHAWFTTTGSEKVVVAVLDSGVDYNHEDLVNNIWQRPASVRPYEDRTTGLLDEERGYNAIDDSGDPFDDNGHGTHCAGIIGAEGDNKVGIAGVNWKVQIMPLKFMNAGGFGTTKDAIEAINYAINRKRAGVNVRVINASWGSTMRSKALEDVIRKANDADILFVAAAGNASTDNDRRPHYPSSYAGPNVISVAAMDRNDLLAPFSNFGARSVHIAAPGKDILSTWLGGDYELKSGTSMATPVVAGVAALVLSARPNLSVSELRALILKSVDELPSLKGKVVTGGRINAAKALGK
jgi:subtilisin family serine protease